VELAERGGVGAAISALATRRTLVFEK